MKYACFLEFNVKLNMMTRAGVWKSVHMLPTLALLPGEPEVPLCCRVGGNYCLTDSYKSQTDDR